MANGLKIDETKELIDDVKKDNKLKKYKRVFREYIVIFILMISIIVFQIVFISIQYNTVNFYKQNYKMNAASLYNLEKLLTKNDRRKIATSMIMKVALKYNSSFNEKTLVDVANLIYEIGELKYDIPVEEWIVLFTYESQWHIYAVSHKGAKGLGQLMPDTAQYIAKALDITWREDLTLFNPRENIRISMRYYFDLKARYKRPDIYISSYCWGGWRLNKFFKSNQKLSGIYREYIDGYKKKKSAVENLLGVKIEIDGL
ncbi:MAG: lytic transglycosylase domain-containing protein [Candidatus Nanoarchaeia archaeon]|nr:lytic transglycosylase domain-containing protein [Candidatus Nanoarchaeia archaeon]